MNTGSKDRYICRITEATDRNAGAGNTDSKTGRNTRITDRHAGRTEMFKRVRTQETIQTRGQYRRFYNRTSND